jgi:phosphoribosylanthranilate isomerase
MVFLLFLFSRIDMLKTLVKVSGIENLSDARYCAGMGVEFLGFPLTQIPFEKFQEIRQWISGVEIVGELIGSTTSETIDLIHQFKPDRIEVDSKANLIELKKLDLPIILRVNLDSDNLPTLFTSAAPFVTHFLLTGDSSESLIVAESQVEIWAAQYSMILGLQIPGKDLEEWVSQSSIKGIGLISGKEDRPGFRDFTDLMTILEKLEID